jgi:hypothetical protein
VGEGVAAVAALALLVLLRAQSRRATAPAGRGSAVKVLG